MARRSDQAAEQQEQVEPTKRVVLHGGTAIMLGDLPDEVNARVLAAVKQALKDASFSTRAREATLVVAWTEVGNVDAATMGRAIDELAGKPGTAVAKVGLWKAPALRSWAGGRRHTRPPEPLIQAEAL